jgi:hypothetical protein
MSIEAFKPQGCLTSQGDPIWPGVHRLLGLLGWRRSLVVAHEVVDTVGLDAKGGARVLRRCHLVSVTK